jgi:hypothetical protein
MRVGHQDAKLQIMLWWIVALAEEIGRERPCHVVQKKLELDAEKGSWLEV